MEYRLRYIDEAPEWLERAAEWFHQKWGIPLAAYRESMEESLTAERYPRWLIAVSGERIIGGLGVIENDFHDRKDLFPNVCAVYVEEDCRCSGLPVSAVTYPPKPGQISASIRGQLQNTP